MGDFPMNKKTVANVQACIDDAGGVPEVARQIKVRDWAVRKWYNTGRVPVSHRWGNRVMQLIDLANCAVGDEKWAPHDLRPDIYVESATLG